MSNASFDEWFDALSEMPFEDRAKTIKDKIYEKTVFDEKSKIAFDFSFDYALDIVKNNKRFDIEYFYNEVKSQTGHTMTMVEFSRILTLLEYCGFNFDYCYANRNK